MFRPSKKLIFENGLCLVFKAKSAYVLPKLRYARKLGLFYAAALYATIQPFWYGNFTIMLFWMVPWVVL